MKRSETIRAMVRALERCCNRYGEVDMENIDVCDHILEELEELEVLKPWESEDE